MSLIDCRLLVDPPGEATWNMAVDEALLEDAIAEGLATLRLYRWSEPTLSLGYFQSYADRRLHLESSDCPCVRRLSGGGAILHDQELTYSLALPASLLVRQDPTHFYRSAHSAIISVLKEVTAGWGIEFRLCDPAIDKPVFAEDSSEAGHSLDAKNDGRAAEPFLCFQRRADLDVLISPQPTLVSEGLPRHKVVGSAQRKRRGALLQHGSLLIRQSALAPQLQGIADFASNNGTNEWLQESQLGERLAKAMATQLGLKLQQISLNQSLRERASQLQASRFAKAEWTMRR